MRRNESVVRAFGIIEYLSEQEEWLSLRTLARELNLDAATAHRFLTSLKDLGYVQQHPDDSRYQLSLKFAWIASRVLERTQLRNIVHPLLEELTSNTNETTHLAVLESNQAVYIDKVDNKQGMQMRSRIGSRVYLHSTSVGRAILAFLPDEERSSILEQLDTPNVTTKTITDLALLRKQMELIQNRGYAVDDEENEVGIRCVGAPLFDHTGCVAGAVSISGWTITMTLKRCALLGRELRETCRNISRQLGYQQVDPTAHTTDRKRLS